jgi:hypothetical protein
MALVHGSWRSSFRGSFAAGPIPMTIYDDVYRQVIANILARPASVVVAYHPEADAGQADLYGWLCYEPGVVHYAFVKLGYRRSGIARGLFKAAGIDPQSEWTYTFKTEMATKLAAKIHRARWNPLAARYEPGTKEAA